MEVLGDSTKDETGTLKDPVTIYAATGRLPSYSETVWPGLQFQPVASGTPFERVYPNLYLDALGSDTKAPKGYFVIDVVNRGASRAIAVQDNKTRYPSLTLLATPFTADYTSRMFCIGRVCWKNFLFRILWAYY